MKAITKVIWIFILNGLAVSSCLNSNTLRRLGFSPAGNAQLPSGKSLCGSIFNQFPSCVEEKPLESLLRQNQRIFSHFEAQKYAAISEQLEPVVEKFNTLIEKIGLENFFLTSNAEKKILEVLKLIPKDLGALVRDIQRAAKNCSQAQNRISVGSFCLLSSNVASDFTFLDGTTFSASEYHKKITTSSVRVLQSQNIDTTFRIKVTQEAADDVISACIPLVHASCIYKKIAEVHSAITDENFKSTKNVCNSKILNCYGSPSNCNEGVKNEILEAFFEPFSSKLTTKTEIAQLDHGLTSLIGSLWERTKETLSSTYERLSSFTSEKYKTVSDLTEHGYNAVSGLFDEIQTRVNLGYSVSSEGRNVVADGNASGVFMQSASLFPAFIGLIFIMAQMFF